MVDCRLCLNQFICKFKGQPENLQNAVDEMEVKSDANSPISVEVKCSRYSVRLTDLSTATAKGGVIPCQTT